MAKLTSNKLNQLRESEILAQGFLDHLTNSEKLHLLEEIVQFLQNELKSTRSLVRVVSAIPLTEKEKEVVADSFSGQIKHPGDIRFDVDSKILGGIKVFYGDNVIDLSTKGKLESIASQI